MTPLNMELMNELNEKVDILMTENALMVEQKSVLAAGMAHVYSSSFVHAFVHALYCLHLSRGSQ